MREREGLGEWFGEWLNDLVRDLGSEWLNGWFGEWFSEWVSEYFVLTLQLYLRVSLHIKTFSKKKCKWKKEFKRTILDRKSNFVLRVMRFIFYLLRDGPWPFKVPGEEFLKRGRKTSQKRRKTYFTREGEYILPKRTNKLPRIGFKVCVRACVRLNKLFKVFMVVFTSSSFIAGFTTSLQHNWSIR